jgi:hypothetical protein
MREEGEERNFSQLIGPYEVQGEERANESARLSLLYPRTRNCKSHSEMRGQRRRKQTKSMKSRLLPRWLLAISFINAMSSGSGIGLFFVLF